MHPALKSDDILCEVFKHVGEDPSNNKTQAYNAALVCKIFRPHALNALWFSMSTLDPLIALIPDAVKMPLDNNALAFCDLLRAEHLSTFELYARRIHQLHLPFAYHISVPVMMELLDALDRRHLLPNLRVLNISRYDCGLNEADSFFLCPTLECLTVRTRYQRDLCYLLPRIEQNASSLRHLHFVNQAIPNAYMDLLGRLPNLQTLESRSNCVVPSDSPARPFSSCFPFAAKLVEWHLDSIIIDKAEADAFDIVQLPRLITLNMTHPTLPKRLVAFATYFDFPELQSLTFPAPSYHDHAGAYRKSLQDLFTVLFTNLPPGLMELNVTGDKNITTGRPATEVDLEDLVPQTDSYRALKVFNIGDCKLLHRPTSTSISALGAAFPFLITLRLWLHKTNLISFDIVALLATKLPLLEVLDVGIQGSGLADPPSVPLLSHPLKALWLRNSVIGSDPFLFSRYVDHLFPFAEIGDPVLSGDSTLVASALKLVRNCRQDQEARIVPQPLRRSRRHEG